MNKFFLRKYAKDKVAPSYKPYTTDFNTFIPPGARHIHTSMPGDPIIPQKPSPDDDKIRGINVAANILKAPVSLYRITPKEAYISMYGKNRELGERMFNRARAKRIEAIRKSLIKAGAPDDVVSQRLSVLLKDPNSLPPLWPSYMTDYNKHLVDMYAKDGEASRGIDVTLFRGAYQQPTSVHAFGQPMFIPAFVKNPPMKHHQVVIGDFANTEADPQQAKALRDLGQYSHMYGHEIMHPLNFPVNVDAVPKKMFNAPVKYTSTRKGYGNLSMESYGGIGQLKAFFGRNFNYVPKTFDDALADLESRGMIERDPNAPYNEYRFTDKFGDEYTTGFGTTLEDAFTNIGYQDTVGDYDVDEYVNDAGEIENPSASNTDTDIRDKYREDWDLASNRRRPTGINVV